MNDRFSSRMQGFDGFANATVRGFSLLLLIVFVLTGSRLAMAQSTFGSVRGVAQDDSGAVLPGAQIALHSLDENTDRQVKTEADGSFTIENVKPGRYSLRADISGFAGTVMNGIAVEARQDVRLTVVLTVAAQTRRWR